MLKWFEKILKCTPREKLLKAPFAIYLDLECLLKKEQSCENNPEKSYTVKKARHDPSGWAMFLKCSFDKTDNKLLDYYREEGIVLKKLCIRVTKES